MRKIDTMSKEQIVAELVRIVAYCNETYKLYASAASTPFKTPAGSRVKGEAIGRRAMCVRIAEDIVETFGIKIQDDSAEGGVE